LLEVDITRDMVKTVNYAERFLCWKVNRKVYH